MEAGPASDPVAVGVEGGVEGGAPAGDGGVEIGEGVATPFDVRFLDVGS